MRLNIVVAIATAFVLAGAPARAETWVNTGAVGGFGSAFEVDRDSIEMKPDGLTYYRLRSGNEVYGRAIDNYAVNCAQNFPNDTTDIKLWQYRSLSSEQGKWVWVESGVSSIGTIAAAARFVCQK